MKNSSSTPGPRNGPGSKRVQKTIGLKMFMMIIIIIIIKRALE